MPKPRKRLVSLEDTPYYHCISRCVRRAFLCGKDPLTGFDFSHRRGWIVARIKKLTNSFAIDLLAYAVMSNHYHIVVRVDQKAASRWSEREVAERWLRLFRGPKIVHDWLNGENLGDAQLNQVTKTIEEWRHRISSLSWFMRCLNEPIARLANREDDCRGRFWEGRFRSQALLDERALLACMAYVDLNPIRAGVAATPEASDFTSIQDRILNPKPLALSPLASPLDARVPFTLTDYLQLLDWTGRSVRVDKPGHIPLDSPPILERLGMKDDRFLEYVRGPFNKMPHALGSVDRMRAMAKNVGLRFIAGMAQARNLCSEFT